MAYIRKRGKSWFAEVERAGQRASKTFQRKAEAEAWALQTEQQFLASKRGELPKQTVLDALDRYEAEVSVKKRGFAWEKKRIAQFKRERWATKLLQDLTTDDLARWRDRRLKEVSSGSVLRDITLLRAILWTAVREWKWIRENPFSGLQVPQDNKPRNRLPTLEEVRRICRALGYRATRQPQSKSEEIARAWLLALRTAMRAGELLSLTPADVDLTARVAHLSMTKNGDARDVPLSKPAVRLLRHWKGWTVSSRSLDALFRKARDKCGIVDLHFHDSRAYALTQMSKKLNPFELARVSGHRDLKTLMDHYYRATPAEIALKL